MGFTALYQAGRSRILMMLAIIAVAATAVFAVSAQAAPPLPDGCINLAGCDGAGALAAAAAPVTYGDSVRFAHSVSGKMAKKHHETINVVCKQDGETVYNWFGQTDFSFPIGSQGGNVYIWEDGTEATCSAHLRYYANNRVSVIASFPFEVSGS